MHRPRRKTTTLASLLPSMLLVAVLGTAGAAAGSGPEAAPVVDLTVRSGSR